MMEKVNNNTSLVREKEQITVDTTIQSFTIAPLIETLGLECLNIILR